MIFTAPGERGGTEHGEQAPDIRAWRARRESPDGALEDVATTPALEFIASVPGPDPDTKAELIAHIKRLYDLINRDELSAADLADWTRGIERCLDEMDYGIEVEVFDRLSDAQELLREHEEEQLSRDEYAERVKLTLAERFEKDLIL